MEGRWMVVCLLWSLTLGTGLGETVPCMQTRAQCEGTGFSSLSIINRRYRCCAPGFSMSVVNADCSCTRTGEARNCSVGPVACQSAASVTSDGAGNTLCCPPGFGMSSQVVFVDGRRSSSCTCLRGGGGSSVQVLGGNGMVSVGNSGGFNTTAMAERFRNWRQRFQQNMSAKMQALRQQMRNLRNRMASMFRGW